MPVRAVCYSHVVRAELLHLLLRERLITIDAVPEVPDGFNVLACMQGHKHRCNARPWSSLVAWAVVAPELVNLVCRTFASPLSYLLYFGAIRQ